MEVRLLPVDGAYKLRLAGTGREVWFIIIGRAIPLGPAFDDLISIIII